MSGYGLLTREQTEKERVDQDHTIRVLQKHRLATLNTWGKKSLAATYVRAKGSSQIDFVCVRQAVADGQAKTARPVKTAMAGWRSTGHLPILGSIPEGDDSQLRNLCDSPEACSVSVLRQAVRAAGAAAPTKLTRPELAPVQTEIRNSWKLRRRMQVAQTLVGAGYIFVFRFMRIRIAYLKAHKCLKKALRNRKRQRTLQLLHCYKLPKLPRGIKTFVDSTGWFICCAPTSRHRKSGSGIKMVT